MLSNILKQKTLKNPSILRLKILIQRIVLVPPYDPLALNNNVENYLADMLSHCQQLAALARYNGFSIIKMIKYIKDELLLVLGTNRRDGTYLRD